MPSATSLDHDGASKEVEANYAVVVRHGPEKAHDFFIALSLLYIN